MDKKLRKFESCVRLSVSGSQYYNFVYIILLRTLHFLPCLVVDSNFYLNTVFLYFFSIFFYYLFNFDDVSKAVVYLFFDLLSLSPPLRFVIVHFTLFYLRIKIAANPREPSLV